MHSFKYGSFFADITTGPGDEDATAVAAFVFPKDFVPPPVDSLVEWPEAYEARALAWKELRR